MAVRSMTGFAQINVPPSDTGTTPGFSITLKSVNHRFFDLHLRLPGDSDGLEMKLRRAIKGKIARGHVELTVSYSGAQGSAALVNREIVGSYVQAFREAQQIFGVGGEVDLNNALRLPGAMSAGGTNSDAGAEDAVVEQLATGIKKLNVMREQEGEALVVELTERTHRLRSALDEVSSHRDQVLQATHERIRNRLSELLSQSSISEDRVLQEAAILAERSDVQEEIARLRSHIEHFHSLLMAGGEVGKKLDFLLQEFSREANTLLSKTSGLSLEGMKITELGLTIKSEIEKLREQVQNLE
ncbi:MAG: YicC family protein [Acidobacteriaceae bacterium]